MTYPVEGWESCSYIPAPTWANNDYVWERLTLAKGSRVQNIKDIVRVVTSLNILTNKWSPGGRNEIRGQASVEFAKLSDRKPEHMYVINWRK